MGFKNQGQFHRGGQRRSTTTTSRSGSQETHGRRRAQSWPVDSATQARARRRGRGYARHADGPSSSSSPADHECRPCRIAALDCLRWAVQRSRSDRTARCRACSRSKGPPGTPDRLSPQPLRFTVAARGLASARSGCGLTTPRPWRRARAGSPSQCSDGALRWAPVSRAGLRPHWRIDASHSSLCQHPVYPHVVYRTAIKRRARHRLSRRQVRHSRRGRQQDWHSRSRQRSRSSAPRPSPKPDTPASTR